jgi:hypothetical protein
LNLPKASHGAACQTQGDPADSRNWMIRLRNGGQSLCAPAPSQ